MELTPFCFISAILSTTFRVCDCQKSECSDCFQFTFGSQLSLSCQGASAVGTTISRARDDIYFEHFLHIVTEYVVTPLIIESSITLNIISQRHIAFDMKNENAPVSQNVVVLD